MAEPKRHATIRIHHDFTWGITPTMGITVRKNSADPTLGPRNRLNFIEGTGIGVTIADDQPNNEVDITIDSTVDPAIAVRKNSGAVVGTRPRLNLIEGNDITITVTDDAGDNEVDITIATVTIPANSWRQDFLPKSQWGRRGLLGCAATSLSLGGILDDGGGPALVGSSSSRVIDATGAWGRSTVSAGAAAATEFGIPAFTATDGAMQLALLPIWRCRMRTGVAATSIAGARFWYGLSNVTAGVSSPQAGVNVNTLHAAGFRFFPTSGDVNWQAVSGAGDSINGQTTDTGVVVAASNAVYEFVLDMSVAGTIDYYINDVLVHSESTVLPGNTTNLGIVSTGRQVTTGTARSVDWLGDNIRYTVNL